MRRAISTLGYARSERLHPGLLDHLVSGGAEAIEIFAARGHFNYTDRQHIREIGNWFRSTGVTFHSMHSPMHSDEEWGRAGEPPLNIASAEKRRRIAAMDEIKRAIEVAEHSPFQFLIQHVGTGGEEADEHKLEAAVSSLEHLRAFAKPLGVQLLVENIPNELSTPPKLIHLLRTGHFADIGVCFDVGHAHMSPGVPIITGNATNTCGPGKAQLIGLRPCPCCAARPMCHRFCWRSSGRRDRRCHPR